MHPLLQCIAGLVVLYSIVSWILPKIVAHLFERKFEAVIRIGRIGIPYLRLCDILIVKNGITIQIEEIGIRSSFINSELTKLITLVVKDVRIYKEIDTEAGGARLNKLESFRDFESSPLDFQNKKIPHFITIFAQFMAIHVYNVSAILLQAATRIITPVADYERPGWMAHATADELHLDGSIVQNARTLLVNVNLSEVSVKLLRHPKVRVDEETCLAELSFATVMEATFVAQGPLSVERLLVGTSRVKATLNDQFYRFYPLVKTNGSRENVSVSGAMRSRRRISEIEDDVFNRVFPIVPKNFMFKMEDMSLRSVGENRTEFISTLKVLTINVHFSNVQSYAVGLGHLPSAYVEFQMLDWHVYNTKEELLLLKSLAFDSKLENCNLASNFKLDTLLLTYNHKVIFDWVETNFLHVPAYVDVENNPTINTDDFHFDSHRQTLFQQVWKKLVISGRFELCHVSALLNLDDKASYIGFSHTKLDVEQSNRSTNWQAELLVESMWWSFKEWSQEAIVSRKTHFWGTPVYLGMILLKLESFPETKIELLMDTIQLEFNYKLVWHITSAIRCLQQYKFESGPISIETKKKKGFSFSPTTVNVELTHFNLFFESFSGEYLIVRLNSFLWDKTIKKVSTVHLKGLKVLIVKAAASSYNCVRTEEIRDYKIFVKSAVVEVKEKNNASSEINLHLLEEIVIFWSANFHLRVDNVWHQVDEFVKLLRQNLSGLRERPKQEKNVVFNFRIFGSFAFHIWISKKHRAKIALDEITISRTPNNLLISNSLISMFIDDAEIFTVEGIAFSRIHDHPLIRAERSDNENFRLPWNKTWGVSIESFKASFPHVHNFAEAVQDELKTIIKWLKSLYRSKHSSSVDSPLPSDLLIRVREFVFEMSDDPFEVKLRENYELLEDEYNESVKRQKMLKSKIGELCATHLHLPAGKVEELYANLRKKNAEIYVQRSKQMLHAAPPRTRLFAWSVANLELMILADPSIHGTENVISVMKEIDHESPWPEDGLQFSTLWCRVVSMKCKEWKFQLRDFQQPLMCIRKWYLCGQLVGAEQLAPRRATRIVEIDLGSPLGIHKEFRSMLPLKFYHDFNCEIESFSYAFGPCWESVMAQCQLTLEKIFAPTRDPSPPLPFWDKMRLLLHGRLTMVVQQLTVLLHASLDPYNTTEEMELTWNGVIMDWTNAKFVYKGDLNIFVRTASKYDDCKLLHLPNLKLIVNLQWVCLGDPNDHHNVMYCNEVPEYSSNQEHDSFRAFRSQNINLGIVLETKPVSNASPGDSIDYPMLSLYSSTLRWIENLKLILSGVTRPTRRGRVFNNVRPRKIQLSRHYKRIHLLMGLHRFQVCYWMSFAMQRGFELLGGRLSSSSEHALSLVSIDDGLKHRPKAAWSTVYMNSELNDAEIWLKSALQEDPEKETISLRQPVEKCFCLSVAKVSYGRETIVMARQHQASEQNKDTPTHRLVVYDLKGAWTKSNRNVAFALFDSFMRNQRMKKNLSTEALKGFRKESNSTPLKLTNTENIGTPSNPSVKALQSSNDDNPSPLSKIQSGHAADMLKRLIAEADNKAVVFSDDLSSATRQQHLQGLQACQEDDVLHKNWLIALVNAQVLLKGCETRGYVILSSAKAEILQRLHRPVWRDRTLVSKTTWVGSLECLQYYATVNAGENDAINDNINWLTVDNIQEKESTVISEIPQVPNIVGSGVSVGAVVSDIVGAGGAESSWPVQLQRIVSRCKCEFFYAGYGDISADTAELGDVPPPPQEDVGLWDRRQTAVDAFTLMHHDLDVCTNSLQYAMLLDIVNNLLLYVEPHRKEALERLARMRFQIQLNSVQDQRRPIQVLQNQIRSTVSKLRKLEKETYLVNKNFAEDPNNLELLHEMQRLEELVYNCKGQLNAQSEELDMMISCYKESQLLANSRMATTRNDKPLTVVRANEICFKHAQWRLTEADGQIGIADLVLSNFLYTKNSKSDDSVEHLLELGYVRMTNLLPNQIYKEVLLPTEIQSNMPVEHKRVVRVFCREKPPVGGISVKEHFEINVVPLTIALTKKFYNTMLKFCFPEKDPENIERERGGEEIDADTRGRKHRSSGRAKRDSNFYIPIDDVEKMKERAEKNKLFIYIKIPEVPVRVSYKGNKEKNLEDIRDFSLVIPTLEYHNVTWTWLDLLLAMKSDTRRVILSQAIKQKLQIKRNTGSADENSSPHEEDKAKMLFGARHAGENRSTKRGISSVFKSSKLP